MYGSDGSLSFLPRTYLEKLREHESVMSGIADNMSKVQTQYVLSAKC
jgi:hypothetical protein